MNIHLFSNEKNNVRFQYYAVPYFSLCVFCQYYLNTSKLEKGPIIEAANGEMGQVLAVMAPSHVTITLRSSAIWTLIRYDLTSTFSFPR